MYHKRIERGVRYVYILHLSR